MTGTKILILPFAPRTKKNSSRIVKIGKFSKVLPSKAYEKLEKQCLGLLPFLWDKEPISKPINLKCYFYKDRNYKSDLVGYLQAIQDILVKGKVLSDDNHNIVNNTNGSKVFLDRQNPRIEIYITEIEDYDNDSI